MARDIRKEVEEALARRARRAEVTTEPEPEPPGKKKEAAVLFLLGASLTQISAILGIQRATVTSYVRDVLPARIRSVALLERRSVPGRRNEAKIDGGRADDFHVEFLERWEEFKNMGVVEIAATLKREEGQ